MSFRVLLYRFIKLFPNPLQEYICMWHSNESVLLCAVWWIVFYSVVKPLMKDYPDERWPLFHSHIILNFSLYVSVWVGLFRKERPLLQTIFAGFFVWMVLNHLHPLLLSQNWKPISSLLHTDLSFSSHCTNPSPVMHVFVVCMCVCVCVTRVSVRERECVCLCVCFGMSRPLHKGMPLF